MSDYIDRQALILSMMNASTPAFDENGKPTFLVDYVKVMESLPSADVQPVRHGRWERKMDGVYCSECYLGWDFITGVPSDVESGYKHCPNCGARMDGERK